MLRTRTSNSRKSPGCPTPFRTRSKSRAEHRASRPFRRPHRREPESQPRRPAEAARNHLRRGAAAKLLPLLNREQEVLTLSSKIQNDVGVFHCQDAARFFSARTIARHSARTRRRRIQFGRNQIAARKNRADAHAREARKAAEQELERLQQTPPAAAEYAVGRIISTGFEHAVGKSHRGQAGFGRRRKNLERATFRPGESQGSAARIHSPSSNAASKSKDRFSAWPARRRRQTSLGKKRGGRARTQIRAHFTRRHAR